jgi:hypothetical protein
VIGFEARVTAELEGDPVEVEGLERKEVGGHDFTCYKLDYHKVLYLRAGDFRAMEKDSPLRRQEC